MKHFWFSVMFVTVLALFAGVAEAQKKKPPVKKPPATVVPPLEVRAGREKVDIQLANVNRFIDVLGPIAQGIEALDESAREKPLSKAANDQNEANKKKVIAAIRNLRDGLANLASE